MKKNYPVVAGQFSDAGIKSSNDDCCGLRFPDEGLLASKGIVAVIADGVSSSEGAREAAETCVQGFLNDYYSTPESWTVKNSGRRVLGALNRWLFGLAQRSYSRDRALLSTLSILILKSNTAYIFHVGDTRIYRLRNNDLECFTRDHTIISAGDKRILARAMGADANVEIDFRTVSVQTDDLFLLTTDGVHEYITEKSIKKLITQHKAEPEQAAKHIVSHALENGSNDNVTCQLIRVDKVPQQAEEEFYRELTKLPFPPPLEAGMILDGYRILRELHASKKTQIYLAIDIDTKTKVIIKTPSVNYEDDPEYIDQFLHEEWAGRRIKNSYVLKVIETQRKRQFLYYITEYVEGQTLRQWMNDHPHPPLSEVRNIIDQLSKGLRAFHRLEMVHQDLKPENVIIDSHNTVKIIDFGSTKIAGIEETQTPIKNDTPMATINYAAPEYFLGHPGNNRSDGFSLGVVAYEILSGKLPYGEALSKRNIKKIKYKSLHQVNRDVPPWIDGAIKKAVRLDPRQRYASSSEFIFDLTHPNINFTKLSSQPLLERDPVTFWQSLCILLALSNLVLVYFLLT